MQLSWPLLPPCSSTDPGGGGGGPGGLRARWRLFPSFCFLPPRFVGSVMRAEEGELASSPLHWCALWGAGKGCSHGAHGELLGQCFGGL